MSMMKIFIAVAFMACLALTQAEVGYQSPGMASLLAAKTLSELCSFLSSTSLPYDNSTTHQAPFSLSQELSRRLFKREITR